jgi:hypothetical protein
MHDPQRGNEANDRHPDDVVAIETSLRRLPVLRHHSPSRSCRPCRSKPATAARLPRSFLAGMIAHVAMLSMIAMTRDIARAEAGPAMARIGVWRHELRGSAGQGGGWASEQNAHRECRKQQGRSHDGLHPRGEIESSTYIRWISRARHTWRRRRLNRCV